MPFRTPILLRSGTSKQKLPNFYVIEYFMVFHDLCHFIPDHIHVLTSAI